IQPNVNDEFQAEIPQPFQKVHNKYIYLDHAKSVNWFGAVESCHRINGHLINLQSIEDLERLQTLLNKSYDYWTDLNNLVDLKVFYSLTTGSKGNLLNEPSHDGGNKDNLCGLLRYDNNTKKFKLLKQNCSSTKGRPICETTRPTTIQVLVW
ncbi:hypothetical protein KR093_006265, partial [Drosophila rubida]